MKPGTETAPPEFAELLRVFGRIGVLSFGGPAGQIALMHRELVERRGWLSERQYLDALAFCMLLPGPEAMQLATWAGWRLRGVAGGLAAGLLFVLPGAALIALLAALYHLYGAVPAVEAAFLGVKAAVVAIVIEALLKVAKRALAGTPERLVAALAFAAIFFAGAPFPLIVLAAGAWGALFGRRAAAAPAPGAAVDPRATARTAAVWLAIWLLPLAALLVFDRDGLLTDIFLFFSQLAVVTFGGAYAVLAWMAETVVAEFGWLTPGEMIDALGLAETTPGPLILVVEFVGFLAAAKAGGIGAGLLGAAVALWATFAPCFLWIFAGAPYVERLVAAPRLRAALGGVQAAVVGVILHLTVWFALHVLFGTVTREPFGPLALWTPELSSASPAAAAIAALSAVMLFALGWGMLRTLGCAALLGLAAGAL